VTQHDEVAARPYARALCMERWPTTAAREKRRLEDNGCFCRSSRPYLRLARPELGAEVCHFLATRRDDENSHEHGHARGDAHDWLGAAGSCCDVHVVCATYGQAQSFDVTACWNQIATKIADRLSRRHNASQWTSSTKRRCLGAAWAVSAG